MNQEERPGVNGDQPPYLHIADVLRGEIDDAAFPVGASLPSQAELEGRFEVSRPTIQRALKELRRDGYIDNQRGRPAQVLDRATSGRVRRVVHDKPQAAFALLETEIAEAFEAQHIQIDSYSLSSETLRTALARPLNRVLSGELTPESIRVRVLLPSLDSRLALPQLVDGDDEWPLERLRVLVHAQAVSLMSSFRQVTEMRPEIDQSLTMRAVPITPVEKLYILNGSTVLTGRYRVVKREVTHLERQGEIYDVLGIGAILFPYRADQVARESFGSRYVDESRAWFDSLWSTIAEPLKLS